MKRAFLSYARDDGKKARRLYNNLQQSSQLKVWFDREDLLPGMKWKPAIVKAIREADYFIALLSRRAVSRRGFRHTELQTALEVRSEFPETAIYLIPARLDDCAMPFNEFTELDYADLFPKWDEGVARLCKSLKISPPSVRPTSRATKKSAVRRSGRKKFDSGHYRVNLVDLDDLAPTIGRVAKGLNRVQGLYVFTPSKQKPPRAALTSAYEMPHLNIARLSQRFYDQFGPIKTDYVFCLTDRLLSYEEKDFVYYNYLTAESGTDGRFGFVSHYGLAKHAEQAGVSLEAALAFVITAELTDYFLDIGYHKETRSCPMDFTQDHGDLVDGLRAARFCGDCSRKLRKNPDLRRAVTAMLAWGR